MAMDSAKAIARIMFGTILPGGFGVAPDGLHGAGPDEADADARVQGRRSR